jgi:hypothetical protein
MATGCLRLFASARLEGSRVDSTHRSLISSSHVLGAPVVPTSPRGLRDHWSVFAPFEGRVFLILALGPLEGRPYLVRDRAI